MPDSSTKVVYAALAGNVLVAVSKFVAAGISGSSAMFTEAIHSTADVANQGLLLIGNRRSRTPPDATHAFGYGLEIYFWAFVVAVMVLLAGGAASLYEGYLQLRHPSAIESPVTSLVVLGLSAIFEASSLAVGYREYKRLIHGRTVDGQEVGLWRFITLSKDPNLYESLLEDSAALIGVAFAAVGVAASAYLDAYWADGAASIAIGLLLVADSFVIAMATRSLIAGESVSPLTMNGIRAALVGMCVAESVSDVATLQLGPHAVLVALTVRRRGDALALDLADLDRVADGLREVDERVRHVVFRPDSSEPFVGGSASREIDGHVPPAR